MKARLLCYVLPLLGACAGTLRAGDPRPGQPAVDFTLPDLHGQQVRLSSLRGRAVVLDFWASWCEPCQKELPELQKLAGELGDKATVLAVSIDKDRKSAADSAASLGLTLQVLLDEGGKVAETYNPPSMPTSYVIDGSGVVRHIHPGFTGPADIARLRQELAGLIH